MVLGWPAAMAAEPEAAGRPSEGGAAAATEIKKRACTVAFDWLAHHQMPDGSWSLEKYTARCKDKTCRGTASIQADAAATAFGLLPFLAAGQTHKTDGPYRANIAAAIDWLTKRQEADGNLAKGGRTGTTMYSHALATIALCEAYGLSRDKEIGAAAQKAIEFIEKAQHKKTGGWRYNPGETGDTSVLGWQVSALRSAQLAGLKVSAACLEGARKFLASVATGEHGAQFLYAPFARATLATTAAGLLSSRHLGASRDDPRMIAGADYLMTHLPDARSRNCYYWFYATQFLHSQGGMQWDTWYRALRATLLATQVRDGTCAAGSWDPGKPLSDAWGIQGGRLMVTSLSTLTLEVYYRYLPLFKE
jgi:hypothetical protein